MAKKIVIDPFDPKSVGFAIVELIRFQAWLKQKCDELCKVLATDYALYTVANEFGYTEGGEVVCYVEEIEHGYRIVAEGRGVFVLEYGAGDPAGSGPILGTAPVGAYPGAYSDTHAGTYRAWVDAGRPGQYYYERQPRAGMYYAFRAANDAVQRVAEEVFKA